MTDGRVEIKYVEEAQTPTYLTHLHTLAKNGVADDYKNGDRLVFIVVQDFDRKLFPALQNVEKVYLSYRPMKERGVVL